MPRNVKQISNARQVMKEKGRAKRVCCFTWTGQTRHGYQKHAVDTKPSGCIGTDQQLTDIVEECCTRGSSSILTIDPTCNVADFYVTSATYLSSRFIQTRTGKAAVLPGPAMLNVRKSEKEFKYFAHILLDHNYKIKCTAFVGGDRDKAQQGFLSPLRGCTFLPCKKDVQDDIIRKLSNMRLNDMKMEVLKDIFGSDKDKDKDKGIVDSTEEDEFVAKVSSKADQWDGIEQRIHSGKEPQFSKYFRECIQEDMKEGMLLSTRRKDDLGDEFFF